MSNKLKIVIFDGSFSITTFINRLVTGLVNEYDIYIMGFNEQLIYKIPKVQYIPLGSNQNYFRLVLVSLKYAIQTKRINTIHATLISLIKRNRKKLQQQNLDISLKQINPDIIHLQWLSNISLFEQYIQNTEYKFILSQRGYHVNVRPFVNAENMLYLRKWYPKINGFHSVSCAIKKVSNNIYTSTNKVDHVVYSGLDFKKLDFKNTNNLIANNCLKICSVGRNHWKKGYSDALRALELLKHKNINFHYIIVGVGIDEELLFLRKELGLELHVTFMTKLSQNKVFDLIQESDLFLLPSIEEGIANVCIEAMALGTPVLSSDCGGMSELITHNKTGFLVPVSNPKAIGTQIENIVMMKMEYLKLICFNARKKVEQQHGSKQMVTGMRQLYRTVYENN